MASTMILNILWIVIISYVKGEIVSSSIWENANLSDTSCVIATEEQSLVECGSVCLERQDCHQFCFHDATSLCYVTAMTTSVGCLIPDDVAPGCYVDTAKCPVSEGYALYTGRCIKFYGGDSGMMTYADAGDQCQEDGAHLYHMKTVDDRQPVANLLQHSNIALSQNVWMGGDDIAAEGNFRWSDGTTLFSSSSLWKYGEPNGAGGGEDCLVVWVTASYNISLNDIDCMELFSFVCQTDL